MKKRKNSDHMLDLIVENSDQRMDSILFRKSGYRKAGKKISRGLQNLEKENLTRRQERAVDGVLTAYTEESAFCCKVFYRQGFKDCISLLKELGVLG